MVAAVITNKFPAPTPWSAHSQAFIPVRVSPQVFTSASLPVKESQVSVGGGFLVAHRRSDIMFSQQAHGHYMEGFGYSDVPCFVV